MTAVDILLKEDESIDDLQLNGLKIIQSKTQFRFGMDAILLAHFAEIRPKDHVVDFGTGTAIIPLIMSQLEKSATFSAIEWQEKMAEIATRNIVMNELDERIQVFHADFRDAPDFLENKKVQVIVCNPPYGKLESTLKNPNNNISIARHEEQCSLSETLKSASNLLGYHGRMYIVFPAQRLLELCDEARKVKLEPKRLRFVCSKASKPPYLVLIEVMKQAKPMLKWLPPLIVYNEDGSETTELKQIYSGGKENV